MKKEAGKTGLSYQRLGDYAEAAVGGPVLSCTRLGNVFSSPSCQSSCRRTVISVGALIPIFTRSRSTPRTLTKMLPEMTIP